ncbi:MAG: 2-C-methyl-D-erythritol 4-phosphate cytidylyltransferase, partial [Balneolaceae bacterium]
GKRMESITPKPYLMLGDKLVLEHTLLCFASLENLKQVVVSTSKSYRKLTEEMLLRIFPDVPTKVVLGGKERQNSISNALEWVDESIDFVIIHDAVRPFVTPTLICECVERAGEAGGAIAGVRVKDTIKEVNPDLKIIKTPNREMLWQAQTPQVFERNLLIEAYNNSADKKISGTDDASLIELIGGTVVIVDGDRQNFKLTYPLDFSIAEMLMKNQEK